MKKYATALIIGRFQPFHPGHLYLIKKALAVADKLIIGIGSSNITNDDNPFSLEKRESALQDVLQKEKLTKSVIKIVPIPDTPSDDEWLKNAINLSGPVDVIIGNNDWVNRLYKAEGHPTITVPFYKRHIYEGKKIRARLRKAGKL